MQAVVCRFQTQPSMHSDPENATADVSIPWPDSQLSEETQRRLLLSQNSVTARFEAQKLWDQGYNGAKVKIGVFDTGIRADHPHVKNIRWVCPLFAEASLNLLGHKHCMQHGCNVKMCHTKRLSPCKHNPAHIQLATACLCASCRNTGTSL